MLLSFQFDSNLSPGQSSSDYSSESCLRNSPNLTVVASATATPGLVKNTALFVSNLLFLKPDLVSETLHEHHLVRSYFRCLSGGPSSATDVKLGLKYVDMLEMWSAVCCLLTRCVIVSEKCKNMCINTRDCLHAVAALLNPAIFGKLFGRNWQYIIWKCRKM